MPWRKRNEKKCQADPVFTFVQIVFIGLLSISHANWIESHYF